MSDRTPKPNTSQYLLRDIPTETLQAAKTVLAAEGRTLRWALLRALRVIAARQPRD
jgi:hypothetical protein